MDEIVAAWFGLLLGMSGIGFVFTVVVRWFTGARGGLR